MKIQPTTPSPLPLKKLPWDHFVDLIGKAHRTLAQFDAIISSVEHPQKVFSLLTFYETLGSLDSQKAPISLDELLHAQITPNHKLSNYLNYYSALLETAQAKSISLSLLRKIHKIIKKDSPQPLAEIGRFRTHQNWIGPEGGPISEAYFYPPRPQTVPKYMDQLTDYLHYKEKDPLVQLAIYFAQLLIIHPFMDGNGRVGRSLIPLFLHQKKLISAPLFYLSPFFKRHRLQYFEKLFAITTEKNWADWIRFFLKGIIEEGQKSIERSQSILKLYHTFCQTTQDIKFVNTLFASPILEKLPRNTETIKKLERAQLITDQKTHIIITNLHHL